MHLEEMAALKKHLFHFLQLSVSLIQFLLLLFFFFVRSGYKTVYHFMCQIKKLY